MKPAHAFPLALTLSLAVLGAAATAANATQTAGGATEPGGVVSPPQPNSAVKSDAHKSSSDVAPASNSFTKSQAKSHIEKAGYSDVTNLTKTPDGMWTAKAKKDGKTMDVAVDFKGAVTPK